MANTQTQTLRCLSLPSEIGAPSIENKLLRHNVRIPFFLRTSM